MSSSPSPSEAQELRRLIPLNTLTASRFEQLCSEIRIEDGPKGTVLFHQGDATTEFVYVLSGTISLQAGGVEMDSVDGGSETGRFALAHQNPRKVSAVAKDRIRYLRVNPDLINQREDTTQSRLPAYTVSHSPDTSGGDWISALLRSPVFRRLPPSNLQALLRSVEEIECKAGDVICQQDDVGDYFYIVKQGQCSLTRKPSPMAKEIKLATIKDFDAFGEDALISDKPRAVTVTMATDGVLLRLDKANFLKLVGNSVISKVGAKEAIQIVKSNGAWLDLRLPDLFQQGHPHYAVNIPFFSLRMMLTGLDRHKKYVLVCEDGKVSAAGAYLLIRHGFDAYALKGGIDTLPLDEISFDSEAPGLREGSGGNEDAESIDIELVAWEPPVAEAEPDLAAALEASFQRPSPPEPGEEPSQGRIAADAERQLQRLEAERNRLAREKEQAAAEAEKARQSASRLESSLQSLRQEHERLLRERAARTTADNAPPEALKKELADLKAGHDAALRDKEAAQQEAEGLRKQVDELKSLAEELLSGHEGYAQDEEEVDALRAELNMVREQANAELAALQRKASDADAESAKLRAEIQHLKTQLSVRQVAATVAQREEANSSPKRSLPLKLLWPLAVGALLAVLVLGGLFGLEAGRDLLRSWLNPQPPAQSVGSAPSASNPG
jgi:CRP-like cAMP-binding protein